MEKVDTEKLTRETIRKGGILSLLYFDIHAKTKEQVIDLATGFVNTIIERPGVAFARGEIEQPEENVATKSYSTSVQIKTLNKNLISLIGICMDYSPFAIEILEPSDIRLEASDIQEIASALSSAATEYKKYVLQKLASPQEKFAIEADLQKRAEMGRRLLKEGK